METTGTSLSEIVSPSPTVKIDPITAAHGALRAGGITAKLPLRVTGAVSTYFWPGIDFMLLEYATERWGLFLGGSIAAGAPQATACTSPQIAVTKKMLTSFKHSMRSRNSETLPTTWKTGIETSKDGGTTSYLAESTVQSESGQV